MPSDLRRRLRRAGAMAGADGFAEVYRQLVSTRSDAATLLLRAPASPDRLLQLMGELCHRDEQERMMFVDTALYLPDDLLTKLDRASMAVGLEGRVPLLDHRVIEFAWRLPSAQRQGKRLLRTLLGRYLPRALYERPKMGFEVPIGPWLRGPLRAWADDVLDSDAVRRGGALSAPAVAQAWRKHRDGSADAPHLLWAILMFEAWRRHWRAYV
jgi:asparagine synthase (glutamine-hydrolysing)